MRLLVTGCAGFIGSHVCERLVGAGIEVVGVDNFDTFYPRPLKLQNIERLLNNPLFKLKEGSITAKADLEAIEGPIDAIIHLAAKAGVRPSIANPQSYIDTNITGTVNVAEFAVKRGIQKIVFASSSSVYGNAAKAPFQEDAITDAPISPYAFTKKSGELALYNFFHLYQINTICLRFFTVYGPRQRPDLAINKFVSAIQNGGPIEIYGDGSMARDYTFVADTVDGIEKALGFIMTRSDIFEVVNLGNSHPYTVLELIATIENVLGKKAIIKFTPEQPGDVRVTCADISKAERMLSYRPRVSLQEGIRRFYNWKIGEEKTVG